MVLAKRMKTEQSNLTRPGHNFSLAVLFSNHMGSWPEKYHEIRHDPRSHWLPTNCHRGSKAPAFLSLETVFLLIVLHGIFIRLLFCYRHPCVQFQNYFLHIYLLKEKGTIHSV